MHSYDLVVVGSGPAGRRAAIQAAKLNKKVLVVEKGTRVGGVSVHTGTIPSKTLRETALNLTGWRERGFYGRAYRVKQEISAADLRRRLLITLDHEVDVLEHQFSRNRVHQMRGQARFVDANTLEVTKDDGEVVKVDGQSVLLAVGTKPFRPAHIPFDGTSIVDSDEILEIDELPRSLIVIGAGVIGIEYATIFSALDTAVTVVESRDTMLDFIDKEIVDDFAYQLRDRNMKLIFGQAIESVEKEGERCQVTLENGRRLSAEMVLFAAGRMGATETLELKNCGLEADKRGRLSVDPLTFQTSVPNIYAAGDVVGFPSLASTSMERVPPRSGGSGDRTTKVLPLWHLRRAGDLHLRLYRGRGDRTQDPLRMRHCPFPRNLARAHHGSRYRSSETDLFAEDAPASRRPYRR